MRSCCQLRRRLPHHLPILAPLCSHAGDIVINEVLGQPVNDTAQLSAARDWGVITGSVEWVELANKGSSEVRELPADTGSSLAVVAVIRRCLTAFLPLLCLVQADVSGWTLVRADRPASDGWQIPASTKIAAAGTLLVLCPRGKRKLQAAAAVTRCGGAARVSEPFDAFMFMFMLHL